MIPLLSISPHLLLLYYINAGVSSLLLYNSLYLLNNRISSFPRGSQSFPELPRASQSFPETPELPRASQSFPETPELPRASQSFPELPRASQSFPETPEAPGYNPIG
jgi:hypothetical protein